MAPQSPLEESATTSARWPVRNRVTFGVVCRPGSPFLSVFFLKSQMNSSQKSSKKGLTKKKNRQTDKQTEEIRPIWSSTRTVFWTAKCQILVAKPLKRCPENEQRISPIGAGSKELRGQLKSTSGFSSVVGTLLKLRLRRKKQQQNTLSIFGRISKFEFFVFLFKMFLLKFFENGKSLPKIVGSGTKNKNTASIAGEREQACAP